MRPRAPAKPRKPRRDACARIVAKYRDGERVPCELRKVYVNAHLRRIAAQCATIREMMSARAWEDADAELATLGKLSREARKMLGWPTSGPMRVIANEIEVAPVNYKNVMRRVRLRQAPIQAAEA